MSDDRKLSPELKAKWVAALRSGEFKQGTERLEKDGRFCCLGVLNKISGGENGDLGTLQRYTTENFGISPGTRRRLEGMNDGHGHFKKRSFKYIADPVAAVWQRRRKVGKQRARKLRRRGEFVWWSEEMRSRVWIKHD